ncbi:exopolysaccharide biosynthesis polyprenyl glycosylphosphotransferase [bacterium]|nr:exopolysaccharide biosynthesis polyprenyl glycosylphosphotransferase [bacterium]
MKRYTKYLIPFFALSETFAIVFIGILTHYFPHAQALTPNTTYTNIVMFAAILWPAVAGFFGYYRDRRTWSLAGSFIQITLQWVIVSFLIFLALVLLKSDVSRLSLTLFLISGYLGLIALNRLRFWFLTRIRSKGRNQRIITFVGNKSECSQFEKWLSENPSFGFQLASICDMESSATRQNPVKQLEKTISNHDYDEVLIGSFENRRKVLTELVDIAEEEGCRVRIVQKKVDVYTWQIGLSGFGPFQVFTVRDEPLSSPPAKIFKRSFDFIFSAAVLLILYWWIYIIAAILIKTTSRGPIYFKQRRIGRNGKKFYCYKFRTMRLNGSNSDGEGEITQKTDPRITRIGCFLRKTNIDEFPQFINVLMGDMSIIGPRPHMVEEDYAVADKLRKYRIRRFVRPGISGWAAVNGYRGGTLDMALMQKRVDYDLQYIESWTPWLDLKIIKLTIIQMFTGTTGAH